MPGWYRFAYGSFAAIGPFVILNVFSVWRAWRVPGCADCVSAGGVPFPFIFHGGFVTMTYVDWSALRDDALAAVAVTLLLGVLSNRMLRG